MKCFKLQSCKLIEQRYLYYSLMTQYCVVPRLLFRQVIDRRQQPQYYAYIVRMTTVDTPINVFRAWKGWWNSMGSSESQSVATILTAYFAIIGIIMVASIIFSVIIYWRIFSKAGFSGALGLLMLVPIANIVMLCILAFAEWPIYQELNMLRQRVATMGGPQFPPQSPYPPNQGGPQYQQYPQQDPPQYPSAPQYPQDPPYPQNPQYRQG